MDTQLLPLLLYAMHLVRLEEPPGGMGEGRPGRREGAPPSYHNMEMET